MKTVPKLADYLIFERIPKYGVGAIRPLRGWFCVLDFNKTQDRKAIAFYANLVNNQELLEFVNGFVPNKEDIC